MVIAIALSGLYKQILPPDTQSFVGDKDAMYTEVPEFITTNILNGTPIFRKN